MLRNMKKIVYPQLIELAVIMMLLNRISKILENMVGLIKYLKIRIRICDCCF